MQECMQANLQKGHYSSPDCTAGCMVYRFLAVQQKYGLAGASFIGINEWISCNECSLSCSHVKHMATHLEKGHDSSPGSMIGCMVQGCPALGVPLVGGCPGAAVPCHELGYDGRMPNASSPMERRLPSLVLQVRTSPFLEQQLNHPQLACMPYIHTDVRVADIARSSTQGHRRYIWNS